MSYRGIVLFDVVTQNEGRGLLGEVFASPPYAYAYVRDVHGYAMATIGTLQFNPLTFIIANANANSSIATVGFYSPYIQVAQGSIESITLATIDGLGEEIAFGVAAVSDNDVTLSTISGYAVNLGYAVVQVLPAIVNVELTNDSADEPFAQHSIFINGRAGANTVRVQRFETFANTDLPDPYKCTISFWTKLQSRGVAFGTDASNPAGLYDVQVDTNGRADWIGGIWEWDVDASDDVGWVHVVYSIDTTQELTVDRFKCYINGQRRPSTYGAQYFNRYDYNLFFMSAGIYNATHLPAYTDYSQQPPQLVYPANTVNISQSIGTSGADGIWPPGNPNPYTGGGAPVGLLADFYGVSNYALDPTDFGYWDQSISVWMPKRYTGPVGPHSFHLNFSDPNDLGADEFGNGSFTVTPPKPDSTKINTQNIPVPFSTWQFYDSPLLANTGHPNLANTSIPRCNYATLDYYQSDGLTNPVNIPMPDSWTVRLGTSNTTYSIITSSMSFDSGKWYWEVKPMRALYQNQYLIGVADVSRSIQSGMYEFQNGWYYQGNSGYKWNANTQSTYGSTYKANDIIGVALDLDAGTLTFYKNGVSQGVAFTGLQGKRMSAALSSYRQEVWMSINFGQYPFVYTPPANHKQFCAVNLPEPIIKNSYDFLDYASYSGNGEYQVVESVGYAPDENGIGGLINRVDWQPDLILIRGMDNVANSPTAIYDTLRGTEKELTFSWNVWAQGVETTKPFGLSSFNGGFHHVGTPGFNIAGTTGFPNDFINENIPSSINYWAWMFQKSPDAGFDVVTYEGTGSPTDIPHNAGGVPDVVVVKDRNEKSKWVMWNVNLTSRYGANTVTYLNGGSYASYANTTYFNATSPSAQSFTVGSHPWTNQLGHSYVAYVLRSVPGFSKFGFWEHPSTILPYYLYTNNTFVPLDFSPKTVWYSNHAGLFTAYPWEDQDFYYRGVISSAQYKPYWAESSPTMFDLSTLPNRQARRYTRSITGYTNIGVGLSGYFGDDNEFAATRFRPNGFTHDYLGAGFYFAWADTAFRYGRSRW